VSRKNRKKIHRLKPSKTYKYWLFKLKIWAPSILRAMIIPSLTLVIYFLLKYIGMFSVYYPKMHLIALIVFVVWVIQALRGAVGYWSHRAHFRFIFPVVLLVAFGSCWGGYSDVPIKVWVSPPLYANLPSKALESGFWKKQPEILEGSQIHVSWEDENSPVYLSFNGKKTKLDFFGISEPVATFNVPVKNVQKAYELVAQLKWERFGSWRFKTLVDKKPKISLIEEPEITVRKTIRFSYTASDDFGVKTILVRLTPTSSSFQETVHSIEIPLRSPSKRKIKTTSYVDLTFLPWAGMPVTVQLIAKDGAGQKGWSDTKILTLPSRTFHNPFAKALIEERSKLLQLSNAAIRDEVANVMAGISRQQIVFNGDPIVMMSLRAGAVRLIINNDSSIVKSIGSLLWKSAIRLEEGDLGIARNNLKQSIDEFALELSNKKANDDVNYYTSNIEKELSYYFATLEETKKHQPEFLKAIDWPLFYNSKRLSKSDLENILLIVKSLLKENKISQTKTKIALLKDISENLRTTPPELSSSQSLIARQVSALRTLVQGQKILANMLPNIIKINRKTRNGRKKFKNELAHQIAQQKLILSTLHDVIVQSGLKSIDAKSGELAMKIVIKELKSKSLGGAKQKQEEALALLQNSLLFLTEKMKSSLVVKTQ